MLPKDRNLLLSDEVGSVWTYNPRVMSSMLRPACIEAELDIYRCCLTCLSKAGWCVVLSIVYTIKAGWCVVLSIGSMQLKDPLGLLAKSRD